MESDGFTWVTPSRVWDRQEPRLPTFHEARHRASTAHSSGVPLDLTDASLGSSRAPGALDRKSAGTRGGSAPQPPPRSAAALSRANLYAGIPFMRPPEPRKLATGRVIARPWVPALSDRTGHALTDPVAPWGAVARDDPELRPPAAHGPLQVPALLTAREAEECGGEPAARGPAAGADLLQAWLSRVERDARAAASGGGGGGGGGGGPNDCTHAVLSAHLKESAERSTGLGGPEGRPARPPARAARAARAAPPLSGGGAAGGAARPPTAAEQAAGGVTQVYAYADFLANVPLLKACSDRACPRSPAPATARVRDAWAVSAAWLPACSVSLTRSGRGRSASRAGRLRRWRARWRRGMWGEARRCCGREARWARRCSPPPSY